MFETIALDYDGTITTNVPFWAFFIKRARDFGYQVVLITMRTPEEAKDIDERILDTGIKVIPTSRQAKADYCREHGIDVKIWIDDNPHWILLDAADRVQTA